MCDHQVTEAFHMRSYEHNRLAAALIIHCMNVILPPPPPSLSFPLPTAHIPHPSYFQTQRDQRVRNQEARKAKQQRHSAAGRRAVSKKNGSTDKSTEAASSKGEVRKKKLHSNKSSASARILGCTHHRHTQMRNIKMT